MFWFFRFSSDMDALDEEKKDFDSKSWIKKWIVYKWDNIIAHVFASVFFLYIGEENISEWIGEIADKIPMGANKIGTSGAIGFFGSFIAEGLKKLINIIKT